MGHCPAERRNTRFGMRRGCQEVVSVSERRRDSIPHWLSATTSPRADLNHTVIERAVGEWRQRLQACVRLEVDISSIWCKDDVTYYIFDDFWDNNCQSCLSLLNDSLKCTRNYCVDVSIWHFEFPKVVLARISGEVGTLCTVLLSVYSGTCPPIFTEIGSKWTDISKR